MSRLLIPFRREDCKRRSTTVLTWVVVFSLPINGVTLSQNKRVLYRGRDAHFCAPPAQIPAGVIHAPGSHLGCLTAKRTLGHG
jgi:hypothetical protein